METMRDTSVKKPENGRCLSKVIHCHLYFVLLKSLSLILLWAFFSHIDLNSPDCKYGNSRIGPFQSEMR
jgi:hypothetical protein